MSNDVSEQARYYKRRKKTTVTAVQIDLDTEGFSYLKWGGQQRCRRGDWLISSDTDCYTVSNTSFQRTYCVQSPGRYIKHSLVRATKTVSSGKISTQEGVTAYSAGDYLVDNSEDGSDCYAISEHTFHELYELVEYHEIKP